MSLAMHFFIEIMLIKNAIIELCKNEDVSLCFMAHGMNSKFDKYWGKFDKVNLLLFVAIVIDPRYKLNYIRWCLEEIYEAKHVDDLMMKRKNELTRLYDWYALNVQSGSVQTQTVGDSSRAMDLDEEHDMDVRAKMKSKCKMHLEKQSNMVNKFELEKFLVDDCEEDNDNFDILGWWKANSTKYRILSLIARDVLAIPVSTVASEFDFSTGGRVLDPFRSSLSTITVEALICTQNWLRSPSQISLRDQLDELEDIESGSSSKDVNIID